MEIIDNFLPEELYKEVQSAINDPTIAWQVSCEGYSYGADKYDSLLSSHGVGVVDEKFDIQNVIMLKNTDGFRKEIQQLPIFYDVLSFMEDYFSSVMSLRMKLNLTFCTENQRTNGFHVDFSALSDVKYTTVVLYLNDNNGMTLFEDGTKVESVGNRAVVFDGHTFHAPANQTDTKKRFVLNYNFIGGK